MRLKDKIRSEYRGNQGGGTPGNDHKDYCHHYQCGHCHLGASCEFEHRCAICNKYGHGAHIRRRRTGDKAGGREDQDHHHNRHENRGHCEGDCYHYYGDKDTGKHKHVEKKK